jgi:hypothetical protein
MDEILIEMAQRAGQNPVLCAGLIRNYGKRHGLQWEEIARQMNLDSATLAKLALCRSPRPDRLDQELEPIAAYLGVNKTGLQQFFRANIQPAQTKPGLIEKLKTNLIAIPPKRYFFALAVVAILLLVGALIAFSPQPSTATLTVSVGQVTIATNSHPEQIVTAGQVVNVKTGDSLAVKPSAQAQLRFYDGSSVDLAEKTQLEVQELVTKDDQFRVRLKMLTGRTVSRVLRLLGVGDAFEISTPSSTVSVRGTVFTVQVLDTNTTYVDCTKGVVKVVSGSRQAEVKAGQQLTAGPGQPLEVKPLANEAVTPTETGGQNVPPTGESVPSQAAIATPMPVMGATTPPPTVGAEETPMPVSTETVAPNGDGSTPALPAVTSGSSGPKGTPNSPSQVPGAPPSVVPGNGNPPTGGSEPPGKGGEPPGQTKDKHDKGESGKS